MKPTTTAPMSGAAARSYRRILVPRPADATNLNAQAKNAQAILARWSRPDWTPVAPYFDEPAKSVAANSHLELFAIRPDRLWWLRLVLAYQKEVGGIFYPGLHHRADWMGLRLRRLTGRRVPVVSTIEGLLGKSGSEARERDLAEFTRHSVYCQKVTPEIFQRMEDIYRLSDHIIAISPFLGRVARRLYGDKVSVLPLGVDLAAFRPGARNWDRLRVVGAGAVQAHKRPQVFLALAERFPAADFTWYGEGPMRPALATQAARLGLRNLSFPGPLQTANLAQAFSEAHVMVLPSLSEGVPKVTQEAAASGLAQIVFGFYEAPTVIDGVNGFVVWDDDQLLYRLQVMLSDPALVAKMGRAGNQMSDGWSWDSLAPRWEERICEALNTIKDSRTGRDTMETVSCSTS